MGSFLRRLEIVFLLAGEDSQLLERNGSAVPEEFSSSLEALAQVDPRHWKGDLSHGGSDH